MGLMVGVAASACGSTPTPPSRTTSPSPSAAPRPSAAAGPCASVTTTTDIGSVPPACAALWAPYGVTKVPPANLTDSTPVPPVVVNATNGAVSDTDARTWALAANRAGVWLQWSEANDQYGLTTRIEGPQVVNGQIDGYMRHGISVQDPSCDLFASRYVLVRMDAAGRAFFGAFGEPTSAAWVFVEEYPGPCAITGIAGSSPPTTLLATPSPTKSLSSGALMSDPLLGAIWYGVGAGFCTDRGAPANWCNA